MQICHVCPPEEYYSPLTGGAISTIINQLVVELTARGHSCRVLAEDDGSTPYSEGHLEFLVRPKRKEMTILQRIVSRASAYFNKWDCAKYEYFISGVANILMHEPPDVLVLHNDLVGAAVLRKHLPQTQLVVWLHNQLRTNRSRSQQQAMASSTDHFIACSDFIAEWSITNLLLPRDKTRTILAGVDLKSFVPRDDHLQRSAPIRCVYLGRIDKNKGVHIGMEAVAKLQSEGFPLSMSVIGSTWFYKRDNDPDQAYLQQILAQLRDMNGTYFEHQDRLKLPAVLNQHDIAFVLSTVDEPFGLTNLESMACGLAVIAAKRGGIPEACGGAATLVEPTDTQAVRDALRELVVNDQSALQSKKIASLARARKRPWSVVAGEFERLVGETKSDHPYRQ